MDTPAKHLVSLFFFSFLKISKHRKPNLEAKPLEFTFPEPKEKKKTRLIFAHGFRTVFGRCSVRLWTNGVTQSGPKLLCNQLSC